MKHRIWLILGLLGVVLVIGVVRLKYKEDILDFLPLSSEEQQQLRAYQAREEAARIFVLFEAKDSTVDVDKILDAVDAYADVSPLEMMTQAGPKELDEVMSNYYQQVPYLMTEEDYREAARKAEDTLYIRKKVDELRLQMMMPLSAYTTAQKRYDPLGLMPAPMMSQGAVRIHDGYLMNDKGTLAIAYVTSPYGAMETGQNTRLIGEMEQAKDSISELYPEVSIRLIGGPVVARENANRIKLDSVWAIGLSVVLIGLVLWLTFRRWQPILLIFITISFGWLFGMAVLGFVFHTISAIVLGIGAVLIGIAVNYPLHIVMHRRYTMDTESTMKEVTRPLVIGNITTVAAFLALVPLSSPALRELGVFAAAMLVGTILFSIVWLPRMMGHYHPELHMPKWTSGERNWAEHGYKWILGGIIVVTIVLGWYGRQLAFDSDMSHINYMTKEQRGDFQLLHEALPEMPQVEGDTARWSEFWSAHRDVTEKLHEAMDEVGLAHEITAPFEDMISRPAQLSVIKAMNDLQGRMVGEMSDSFSYLGLICSIVVFIFLWITMKDLGMALIAFLPMAVSWVWILGVMHILGIQFNIVNIILATFIFGQGDDYTIFMVEGLRYEHETGQKMLPQFRSEILLSAVIMFLGIGVLIIARHPAMYSLGAVTLIGMSSVVLMAYILPPCLYRILIRLKEGRQARK